MERLTARIRSGIVRASPARTGNLAASVGNAIITVYENHLGLRNANLSRSVEKQSERRNDDHVARSNEMGCGSIDANIIRAGLAKNSVRLKPGTTCDIPHMDRLERGDTSRDQ